MPSAFGDLNGNGNQQIWIDVARTGQDWGANRSDYRGEVRYYGNGYGSWDSRANAWGWEANFGGFGVGGRFNVPYDQRNQQYHVLWSGTFSRWHDGEGWGSGFYCSAWIDTDHSSIGDGGANTNEENPPRIPQVPAAPYGLSAGNITPTSFGVSYARGDNRGAGIEQDQAIWRRVKDGVDVWDDGGPAGYTSPANGVGPRLTPGTEYDVFVRSRNVRGWGAWSSPARAKTLSGAYVWNGSAWTPTEVFTWNGSAWQTAEVNTWTGSGWSAAG